MCFKRKESKVTETQCNTRYKKRIRRQGENVKSQYTKMLTVSKD